MAQIGSYNEGVRQLRARVNSSKVRAEEGVKDIKSADEKVEEAFRLMGLVGQLVVEAANLHADGAAKLALGNSEIANITMTASRIFDGSDAAAEIIEKISRYQQKYELLANMTQFSSEGLKQDNLPDANKLYGDLRNRGGVMDNLVSGCMARIGEARQLDQDLRGRFA